MEGIGCRPPPGATEAELRVIGCEAIVQLASEASPEALAILLRSIFLQTPNANTCQAYLDFIKELKRSIPNAAEIDAAIKAGDWNSVLELVD